MEPDPSPRERRNSVILHAQVQRPNGAVSCRVRNLSASGACVDNGVAGLAAGERVRVAVGSVTGVVADVAWADQRLAGLRFARAVDLATARRPRAPTTATSQAGWLDQLTHAYRRHD